MTRYEFLALEANELVIVDVGAGEQLARILSHLPVFDDRARMAIGGVDVGGRSTWTLHLVHQANTLRVATDDDVDRAHAIGIRTL